MNARNFSIVSVGLLLGAACAGSTSGGGADASTDATVDSGSDGGGGDGGACSPACGTGRTCCGGQCVNPGNDPNNCGGCGVHCSGATPYCDGSCKPTPACNADGGACGAGSTCCGTDCCGAGQLCCQPNGPLDRGPACETPTGSPPTCPQGCGPLCVSDRTLKRDIVPVDTRAILDAVVRVPVSTWSYKTDAPSIRHMGPMAQDFHGAFGLGSTDRAYDPVDAHGVTFASIQALYAIVAEQNARIERLEEDNSTLRRESTSRAR